MKHLLLDLYLPSLKFENFDNCTAFITKIFKSLELNTYLHFQSTTNQELFCHFTIENGHCFFRKNLENTWYSLDTYGIIDTKKIIDAFVSEINPKTIKILELDRGIEF